MSWAKMNINFEKAYDKSFGDTPDGVEYSVDYKAKSNYVDLQKAALSDRTAGTAGVVDVPIFLDPTYVDATNRDAVLSGMLRRVTNKGRSADYDRLIARSAGLWQTENAASSVGNETYETKNKAIKYLRIYGNVTGPLFAASKPRMQEAGFGDIMNREVMNKSRSLKQTEEESLINGSASDDANEPNGLIVEITNNGNSTDYNTLGEVTLAAFDEMERECKTAGDSSTLCGATPNLYVTDYATENKIKGLFFDAYSIQAPTSTLGIGKTVAELNGIPVLGHREMQAASGSRNIMLLNTDYIETRVLQDMTYSDLAKTNDSDTFMLKEYLTWVVKIPEYMNLYYNVD